MNEQQSTAHQSFGFSTRRDYHGNRCFAFAKKSVPVHHAFRAVLLGLSACVLAYPAHAVDHAPAVIGLSYAQVMAQAPGVINSNLSVATGATLTAHQNWLTRANYCYSDPSGRTQACLLFSTLYHEFVTSPTCAGNWRCGWVEATTYGFKHQHEGFLDIVGRGITVYQLLAWGWEALNWCQNNVGTCNQVIGSSMCEAEADLTCSADSVLGQGANDISVGEDYGIPYFAGDGEGLIGDNTFGSWAFYDWPWGYGSWGTLVDISSGCVDDMGMDICL